MIRFTLLLLLPLASLSSSLAQKSAPRTKLRTAVQQRLPDDGSGPAIPQYKAEAFIGTWEWRSGSDVFRLTITRNLQCPLPNGRTKHLLLGRHSYANNGVAVEESFSYKPSDPLGNAFVGTPEQEWELDMSYVDRTKKKHGRADLVIDPADPDQMQFELHEVEGMYTSKHPAPAEGFTIPTRMTLTRVP